jgi:hypothetical protein
MLKFVEPLEDAYCFKALSAFRVARTRQTCLHSPKAIFEKNVTRLAKFTQVMSESREFGASSHCLLKMHLYS